jgi:hypothetical protein
MNVRLSTKRPPFRVAFSVAALDAGRTHGTRENRSTAEDEECAQILVLFFSEPCANSAVDFTRGSRVQGG